MRLYTPVIIIGAPRSGTNMLRDVLTRMPGCGTWPCDEINYIWRHGNVRHPSDEFTPDMARPEVQRYIRSHFDRIARRYGLRTVVEKTCANSLRVDFVDAVLPEARYVFIYRDGIDVVCSAMKRWKAELDIPYILAKARFVPLSDLPYHILRYLGNRVYRLFSREKRLAFWGPRLNDMDELLKKHSLDEICALQWRRCVESSQRSFDKMSTSKVVKVRYEDFVKNSRTELARICEFLGIPATSDQIDAALHDVSDRSVGKGRSELGEDGVSRLIPLIGETLRRYGYY